MEMEMDCTVSEHDAHLLLQLAGAAPAAALPSKRLRVSERAPPTLSEMGL